MMASLVRVISLSSCEEGARVNEGKPNECNLLFLCGTDRSLEKMPLI